MNTAVGNVSGERGRNFKINATHHQPARTQTLSEES